MNIYIYATFSLHWTLIITISPQIAPFYESSLHIQLCRTPAAAAAAARTRQISGSARLAFDTTKSPFAIFYERKFASC